MNLSRRSFLATSAATSTIISLPGTIRAAGSAGDLFAAPAGEISVHPVAHASLAMETPSGTIYCDPVGSAATYAGLPTADLILVTHEHGDHFDPATLTAIAGAQTHIITNPAVALMLPDALKTKSTTIANGETAGFGGVTIDAIPAYNLADDRKKYHPKGRDNGYVLGLDGFRIYISGDTEDIPEMRALANIDLAFLCMNLPFTMDVTAAASAIADFRPAVVYPYHYRGRDGGTQDPEEFSRLVGDAADVRLRDWYG